MSRRPRLVAYDRFLCEGIISNRSVIGGSVHSYAQTPLGGVAASSSLRISAQRWLGATAVFEDHRSLLRAQVRMRPGQLNEQRPVELRPFWVVELVPAEGSPEPVGSFAVR